MTKRRRRGITSDWVWSLQQSRRSRILRQDLPFLHRTDLFSNGIIEDAETGSHLNPHDAHYASSVLNNDSSDITPNYDSSDVAQRCTHSDADASEDSSDSEDGSSETPDECSNYDLPETSGMPSAGQDNEPVTEQPTELEEFSADIALLKGRRRKWENKHFSSAIVAVVGSVRFTVKQYEYTRSVLSDVIPGETKIWPPYATIQRCFKTILTSSMPQSDTVNLPKKIHRSRNEAQDTAGDQETIAAPETAPVKIFYPSAWAKLDVSTSSMFADKPMSVSSSNSCLENSQMVKSRSAVTDASQHLFVEHNGENVKCFPGSVISISSQSDLPTCDTPYRLYEAENHYSFHATVVASWVIGSTSSPSPSANDAIRTSETTSREKTVMKCLSNADPRPLDSERNEFAILPGDLCTLLRAEQECQPHEYFTVLIHRFWRYETGIPSAMMIWVIPPTTTDTCSIDSDAPLNLHISEAHVVTKVSLRRYGTSQNQRDNQNWKGTLTDGTPFVIYRILLYCDDFQQSSYSGSSGSAGGCYFMPLAIPPEERTKTSSVRLISLTPPGVSTNEVLRHIVPDLVSSTVSGVQGVTIDGERVRIFLDVVGFIGDYPASSGVIDVFGHVGRTPCTLCTFRRPHVSDVEGSRYGYTTDIHSNNPTFLRNGERHKSLRESNISEQDAKLLGLAGKHRADGSPLIQLHEELLKQERNGLHVPLTCTGTPVVPAKFDPYRCNVIAPDHLLTGLSKDILNSVFSSLPTYELRLGLDIFICAALRENGLLPQKEVYNGKTNVIHSMTLSEVFCVLLVAVPVLKILTSQFSPDDSIHEPVRLLSQLHGLIRLTYWWPRKEWRSSGRFRASQDEELLFRAEAIVERVRSVSRYTLCKEFELQIKFG